uniref:CSON007153 protein n=1 Tax=Culicoides sonorensis TaxID=179676 RepID=A0A336N5X3_CULSO
MFKISCNYKTFKIYSNLKKSITLRQIRRNLCAVNHEENTIKNPVNFDLMIQQRQAEARRSVLVQVSSEKSFDELQKYCGQIADIKSAHHYSVAEDDSNFILLEFEKDEGADAVLDASVFNQDVRGIPTRSQFMWFKTGPKVKLVRDEGKRQKDCQLNVINGNLQVRDDEIAEWLTSAESLKDQMNIVFQSTKLSDLGIRLRFLAAQQAQNSIVGMFPNAYAHPFGSSVNGFGKEGCDLDLILRLEKEEVETRESRLVFHTKANLNNGRTQAQRYMESVGDILQLFLPGVNNVRRILQARVPIIKYNHEYLDLEVDLSMSNLTGVYMSEILYMIGQIDNRVRPLVFCIRRWAKSTGLTNPSPGRWISNFSLTLLVLYFLQALKQPILPSINHFIKKARKQDMRVTEDGINCTFLRDLNLLDFKVKNTSSIDELLREFFEFYSSFDFNNRGISLNEAKSILKPDHSAMYIVNPLEPLLNVSKNLSLEETERFRIEVRNAAWILESDLQSSKSTGEPWGLVNLFKTNQKSLVRPQMFFKPRMVDVTDLFDKNDSPSPQRIDYKNTTIKRQVEEITRTTKTDVNKIHRHINSDGSSTAIRAKGASKRR